MKPGDSLRSLLHSSDEGYQEVIDAADLMDEMADRIVELEAKILKLEERLEDARDSAMGEDL